MKRTKVSLYTREPITRRYRKVPSSNKPDYIHGPMFMNSDLTLFKNFKMGESKNLQFRAEAFNFLNHPLYGFTNVNPFLGSGASDAALNLRYENFGALPTNISTAGIMTNKFGHRIMQLELKFYF